MTATPSRPFVFFDELAGRPAGVIERQPRGHTWTQIPHLVAPTERTLSGSSWRSGPIVVTSELLDAEYPDGNGTGPQWLMAISARGKRPKPHHVRRARRAFGMTAAENDTHHPGVAVHLWMPVDPAHRVACQCKADEETITEPDGYRWTNPRGASPSECRGCELARLAGNPCPLHGAIQL